LFVNLLVELYFVLYTFIKKLESRGIELLIGEHAFDYLAAQHRVFVLYLREHLHDLVELFSVVVHFDDGAVDVVVGQVVELYEDVFSFLVVFEQGH
jgi:hypothetical protein